MSSALQRANNHANEAHGGIISSIRALGSHRRSTLVLFFFLVGLGAWLGVAYLSLRHVDRSMRKELIEQTRVLSQAIDPRHIESLTGTESDIHNKNYLRLKEQMGAIASAHSQCRFLYLLGRMNNGALYIMADNVPIGRADEAPAGMPYGDAPPSFSSVFENDQPITEGPYSDRWGSFVSAQIPVHSFENHRLVAAFGMDFDARDWQWEVAARTAPPLALLALILIFGLTSLRLALTRADNSSRLVTGRLLAPLSLLVLVLLACPLLLLLHLNRQQLAEKFTAQSEQITREWTADIQNQAAGLAMTIAPMAEDSSLVKALCQRDADAIQTECIPIFQKLHAEHRLTHLSFLAPDRVCLFRGHDPENRGDLIEHAVVLDSEKTGQVASGIEIGPLGTFMLRVAQPIFHNGQKIGYIELGKELDDVLFSLQQRTGVVLTLILFKHHLDRSAWEAGMKQLNREANWNRMPESVISYSSEPNLSDSFIQAILSAQIHPHSDQKFFIDGRPFRFTSSPMIDAAGKTVGTLLIQSDVSSENHYFRNIAFIGSLGAGLLIATLLSFVYVLLHRTDIHILAQQQALRQSEERNRTLIEVLPDTLILTNAEGLYLNIFASSEDKLFRPKAELLGKTIGEFLPSSVADPILEKIRNAIQSKIFQSFEYELEVPAGYIHFEARIVPSGPTNALVLIRDITQQKLAEIELRESKEQFKSLVSNIPGIFYRCKFGRSWTLLYISPEIETLSGYPPEDFIEEKGRTLGSVIHCEDVDSVVQRIKNAIDTSSPWEMEYRIVHKDGTVRWVHETGRAVVYQIQSLRQLYLDGFILDVTERKRLETERVEMQARLLHVGKLEAVGQLAAGVAHEINTPIQFIGDNMTFVRDSLAPLLSLIDAYERLALETSPEDATQTKTVRELAHQIDLSFLRGEIPKALEESLDGIQRVKRIVGTMREFSRQDAQGKTMSDINAGIRSTIAICQSEWKQVAEIQLDLAPDLPPIPCHPGEINQVLVNLIVNAAHAIRSAVPVGEKTTGRIVIRTRSHPDHIEIQVEDTGGGIPEKIRHRLFEPFFTTKEIGKGTGQGLYLSRNIILKGHGGSITFETEVGKGTVFTVSLPRNNSLQAQNPAHENLGNPR